MRRYLYRHTVRVCKKPIPYYTCAQVQPHTGAEQQDDGRWQKAEGDAPTRLDICLGACTHKKDKNASVMILLASEWEVRRVQSQTFSVLMSTVCVCEFSYHRPAGKRQGRFGGRVHTLRHRSTGHCPLLPPAAAAADAPPASPLVGPGRYPASVSPPCLLAACSFWRSAGAAKFGRAPRTT